MTTIIEDNELNAELQELYLKSKQWISDLEFLVSELEVLKKLFERTFNSSIKNDNLEKISGILLAADNLQQVQTDLKSEILSYLHKLEHLIVNTNQSFNISLVDTYTKLELRVNEILLAFQTVKNNVFDFTKHQLKQHVLTPIS